tara:strand:- start:349 stop:636 length:288 start_codon:yes stop_codon:yes gene_type:complete
LSPVFIFSGSGRFSFFKISSSDKPENLSISPLVFSSLSTSLEESKPSLLNFSLLKSETVLLLSSSYETFRFDQRRKKLSLSLITEIANYPFLILN